jgi:hypothetical protein
MGMVSLPSSRKEKAKLVVEDLAAAVVRILTEQKLLEPRCARELGQGTFREVQVAEHFGSSMMCDATSQPSSGAVNV